MNFSPFRSVGLRFSLPFGAAVLMLAGFPTRSSADQSVARKWNEAILSGIRRNVPNPPAHARNLFHLAAAMYDSWAAYDANCINYLKHEKVSPLPIDVDAARKETLSYAAYRVLTARFSTGAGSDLTVPELNLLLTSLGYSVVTATSPTTAATTPAMLGKRIGDRVISWSSADGFSNTAYPTPYTSAVNPNMAYPMAALGMNNSSIANRPLGAGVPEYTNPNFWQPLSMSSIITQNNIVIDGGVQPFVGVQSLATAPFSLKRLDLTKPWLDPFGGPSKLSTPQQASPSHAAAREGVMGVLRASSKLNSPTMLDISPGVLGNNPLGADSGTGRATNPVTGQPYSPVTVAEGDYGRVLAEFWADGPNSETPPGHWHVLANEIADTPGFQKRIEGTGPVVSDLEWDVKVYFALAGAVHDAASAAWSLKRYYSGARPITQIRWMGTQGQSTDANAPNYSEYGLPLEPGVVEQITSASVASGRHTWLLNLENGGNIWGGSYLGEVVVYTWPGEHNDNAAPSLPPVAAAFKSDVRWMRARDWLPFQRKTFNTPAFPGYVSGHSTFSRSSAEVLTSITGSPYFPGGYHSHTIAANSMQIDHGPSTAVTLGWCSYYDAADQAGQSRRWGGIHVSEDDFHGRIIGSQVGKSAYALAKSYWSGSMRTQVLPVNLTVAENGDRKLTWSALRGMNHRVQSSTNLTTWTDRTANALAYETNGNWVDTTPATSQYFYRVVASGQP